MSTATIVQKYASLVKFSHTIFALPFALIGLVYGYAQGNTTWQWYKLLLVIACMVTARNAAMAFNRWLDASIDAKNPRTAIREIPAGILNAKPVIGFVIINCILFSISAYFLQPICGYLAPVALFVILFYSYTKRFTALCHLVLGLGLSLAPIGAYLAATGNFSISIIVLGAAVLTWVAGFDVIYALQDQQFDKSNQLHSIPVKLGTVRALNTSRILHLCTACLVIMFGWLGNFHLLYWLAAAIFITVLIWQHRLVKPTDLSKINIAFFTTNGIGSVSFAVIVIAAILLKK